MKESSDEPRVGGAGEDAERRRMAGAIDREERERTRADRTARSGHSQRHRSLELLHWGGWYCSHGKVGVTDAEEGAGGIEQAA